MDQLNYSFITALLQKTTTQNNQNQSYSGFQTQTSQTSQHPNIQSQTGSYGSPHKNTQTFYQNQVGDPGPFKKVQTSNQSYQNTLSQLSSSANFSSLLPSKPIQGSEFNREAAIRTILERASSNQQNQQSIQQLLVQKLVNGGNSCDSNANNNCMNSTATAQNSSQGFASLIENKESNAGNSLNARTSGNSPTLNHQQALFNSYNAQNSNNQSPNLLAEIQKAALLRKLQQNIGGVSQMSPQQQQTNNSRSTFVNESSTFNLNVQKQQSSPFKLNQQLSNQSPQTLTSLMNAMTSVLTKRSSPGTETSNDSKSVDDDQTSSSHHSSVSFKESSVVAKSSSKSIKEKKQAKEGQKKVGKKKSKSSYARSRSRKRRRESKKQWPEEDVDSEGFLELLQSVNALYETGIQKPDRLLNLLKKFNWNKFKVVDYIKKNKGYYRRFLDGETGEQQDRSCQGVGQPQSSTTSTTTQLSTVY